FCSLYSQMKLSLFLGFSCQSLRKSVFVWWLGSAMGLPFLSVTARKIERRSYRRYDPKSHHLSLMIGPPRLAVVSRSITVGDPAGISAPLYVGNCVPASRALVL